MDPFSIVILAPIDKSADPAFTHFIQTIHSELITELAASLRVEMGESMSRGFVSLIAHRLGPDATERIAAARHSAERAGSPIASRGAWRSASPSRSR